MDWIEPGLAVGNLDDAMAHDMLRESGIKSVLTLNGFPNLAVHGFNWRRVDLFDGPGNSLDTIWEAVDLLADLHTSDPNVLVHCREGKSRSVLIASLYVARRDRIVFPEAFRMVKASRRVAEMDPRLWQIGLDLAP
ncbi:MAG TPA: dual specificity protein phosphatase [Tepidiformaceae bacterium]|nr:dual specificity protein phosphatase [Tepidiformaceae bacterium]